jgi:uncharacterized sulfatase
VSTDRSKRGGKEASLQPIGRRDLLLGAAALTTALAVEPAQAQAPGARPNILWINCHDICLDLGCYRGVWPGAEYAYTPNLDRLAAQGARYDNAFAVCPVCAPSRSSVITGMFPTAIGTMHMRSTAVPPPEVRCFPEYLRAAGYYCISDGFTDYQFQTPVSVYDDCSPKAHWRNRPDKSQPFFAFYVGEMTHESQIVPGYGPAIVHNLPAALKHDPKLAPIPPYLPDSPAMRDCYARYSDNVTEMDIWAGNLLQQLEEDGLADNTIVVFWSDHGRGFPRAKRSPYDSGLREPLIVRWPGKIAPGTVRKELVSLMDLAATTLVAAGVAVPGHLHSQPLFDAQGRFTEGRPVVFGHRDRMDEHEDTMRTARDSRFRYIRNFHPDRPPAGHINYSEQLPTWQDLRDRKAKEAALIGMGIAPNLLNPTQRLFLAPTKPEEELYDTQADPHEVRNLANDPNYAADLRRLRAALDDWQRRHVDLGLVPESTLIERWRPGGVLQVTTPPIVTVENGQITATCSTDGASIAWTSDPPTNGPPKNDPVFTAVGGPDTGGRSWHLYARPFAPPTAGTTLWFRAQRLGFRASDVRWTA